MQTNARLASICIIMVAREQSVITMKFPGGTAMIQTDDQMLLGQQCVANLRRVLLEARKVHSQQDYTRMAEPILLEIQQREQEILEYLTRDLEQEQCAPTSPASRRIRPSR